MKEQTNNELDTIRQRAKTELMKFFNKRKHKTTLEGDEPAEFYVDVSVKVRDSYDEAVFNAEWISKELLEMQIILLGLKELIGTAKIPEEVDW